jgi:hypothetical protein
VLPDNGSVVFYDSTGEAMFGISLLSTPTFNSADLFTAYYFVQATFLLYDANGNQISPPFTIYNDTFDPQVEVEAAACNCYLGPPPPSSLSYGGLPDGYYTVDITSSAVCSDCLSPLTFELLGGDIPPTPVPSALPLFATGLGAMYLFGWRRKRKNTAVTTA